MTAASPAQELVGAVLNGRFRLVRLLGEGGMGAVYEADSLRGEGKRAVKLLHQEFVKEEQLLQRFFAESEATRELDHRNVARVLETGTAENGTPYLVMELLLGIPLSHYTDQRMMLTPPQAVNVACGVLDALRAAHGRGVIHRDLKPDNLFLVGDINGAFDVKVLDFGIAKVMDLAGGMGQKTRTGVLLGTPGYMSPEQVQNSKGVDGRTDLWSVAVILYELLTANAPFPGDNEFARLTAVLTESPKPIEQIAPYLAGWAPFFQRALARDPARRFQTAEEMTQGVLAAARGASMRPPPPPPTLQGAAPQQDWQRPPLASSPYSMTPAQQQAAPYSLTPVQQQSGLMPSPMSTLAASPVQAHSGLIQSPASMAQPPPHSTGNHPRPSATVASMGSVPPPSMAAPVSSGVLGGIGPTHVSAQRPSGAAMGHTPSIEVVDAPPIPRMMAPIWVVVVVGLVCFGGGLALGLALG